MNDSELTIENLFLQPVQKPFSYNLQLGDNEACTAENVFEHVKKIFVNGLMYMTEDKYLENENGKSLLINKVTKQEIEKVNKYMLSVGIEVVYKEMNTSDKDYYLRGLLYELEKKDYVKINVTIDWKTQFIQTVNLNVDQKDYENLMIICKKHPEANYFLNLYKPQNMKDYTIKYVKTEDPEILHIIYFKPADAKDYHYQHKYFDNLEKHVR